MKEKKIRKSKKGEKRLELEEKSEAGGFTRERERERKAGE